MKPVQIPSFMAIGTTVIELREFKEKKKKKKKKNTMDKMGKICLALIGRGSGSYLSEIFHTQFCFDMFYTV